MENNKKINELDELVKVMELLRSEKGCPWDRAQTVKELKSYVLEEAYELVEAIDSGDVSNIKEELGDLLFQVIFIARLFEEKGCFNIYEVAAGMKEKLIRRHPHVFASVKADTPAEVLFNWETIKKNEKKEGGVASEKHLLDSIQKNLPALMQAYKIGIKAALLGFDWSNVNEIFEKLNEEISELKEAIKHNDMEEIEAEIGDIIFVISNISRFMKIDPEQALRKTNRKFIARFNYIEDTLNKEGKKFKDVDINYLEALWQASKKFIE
jgi:tetrapyrrole methylase family protein/MazG family protein